MRLLRPCSLPTGGHGILPAACSHHAAARYVTARDKGGLTERTAAGGTPSPLAEADLASIVAHHAGDPTSSGPVQTAGEDRSLTQGTAGWAALGATTIPTATAGDAA